MGKSGERGSEISVLGVRHDDDDDDDCMEILTEPLMLPLMSDCSVWPSRDYISILGEQNIPC